MKDPIKELADLDILFTKEVGIYPEDVVSALGSRGEKLLDLAFEALKSRGKQEKKEG